MAENSRSIDSGCTFVQSSSVDKAWLDKRLTRILFLTKKKKCGVFQALELLFHDSVLTTCIVKHVPPLNCAMCNSDHAPVDHTRSIRHHGCVHSQIIMHDKWAWSTCCHGRGALVRSLLRVSQDTPFLKYFSTSTKVNNLSVKGTLCTEKCTGLP